MFKNSKYVYGQNKVNIPVHVHFGRYIIDCLWQYRDNVAFINGQTHDAITFGQIAQEAMNLAVSLVRLGVRKGDKIAILSENRDEYFTTLFGVACTGATFTTINPLYSEGELNHALDISQPRYAICSITAYRKHETILQSRNFLEKIIVFGSEQPNNTIMYNDLIKPANNCLKNENVNGNVFQRLHENVSYEDFDVVDVIGQTDTLAILYSSGTTGLSKGVMLTHYNFISMCRFSILDICDDKIMAIGPWFHAMSQLGTIAGLSEGMTYVYLPKFEFNHFLECVERYKVTMLIAPPPVLVSFARADTPYDLSSVKKILTGSAPLHPRIINKILPKFPNLKGIVTAYGMTEATLAVTSNTFDDRNILLNTASVGKVVADTVVKIVEPATQKVLGAHEHGEICVKGAALMTGYVGKDTSDTFDDEGFFRTGDVGYYDDKGYLYVVERMKELIKYKGNQVRTNYYLLKGVSDDFENNLLWRN